MKDRLFLVRLVSLWLAGLVLLAAVVVGPIAAIALGFKGIWMHAAFSVATGWLSGKVLTRLVLVELNRMADETVGPSHSGGGSGGDEFALPPRLTFAGLGGVLALALGVVAAVAGCVLLTMGDAFHGLLLVVASVVLGRLFGLAFSAITAWMNEHR